MDTETPNWDDTFADPASPATGAVTLLAFGAYNDWPATVELITDIHTGDGDRLARIFAVIYQMIENQRGFIANADVTRRLIGRSLARLNREEYAALRVADVLLDRLASHDVAGFADAWDGVRFAYNGRNVVPVAAAVLTIVLGALEAEDDDANLLLDRLTADGTFASVLSRFSLTNPTC